MRKTKYPPENIFYRFQTEGSQLSIVAAGSGHIHDTWWVRNAEKNRPDYILQRINSSVFPDVKLLMSNIITVTKHLKEKSFDNNATESLEVIPTKNDETFFTDAEGEYWRMFLKIEPGLSYDIVPGPEVAYQAGQAFGRFISDLADLSHTMIQPIIPGFHSVTMRYQRFRQAVDSDPCKRRQQVTAEVDKANEYIDRMLTIPDMERKGRLPIRITHNDTKLNNVLFDNNTRAVCVIDLDTVMPGLSVYDFGDSIRTAANTSHEDETDLTRTNFDTVIFRSYADGFLSSLVHLLTPEETHVLPLAAQTITYIMGLRFLTDFLEGDHYFATQRPGQNLSRCRTQFNLLGKMIQKHEFCMDTIGELIEIHQKSQKS
jgi:Ser/Thr protein kinase RdoA (MazF antagonist)